MVHNGIEYGDMQLISEAYDVLKTVGGFTNEELATAFNEWNNVSVPPFVGQLLTDWSAAGGLHTQLAVQPRS